MHLRAWLAKDLNISLQSPIEARLLVGLVHGIHTQRFSSGASDEVISAKTLLQLHQDAPTDVARFKIFCLQRTPYEGKIAATMDNNTLDQVRQFISLSAQMDSDVIVAF